MFEIVYFGSHLSIICVLDHFNMFFAHYRNIVFILCCYAFDGVRHLGHVEIEGETYLHFLTFLEISILEIPDLSEQKNIWRRLGSRGDPWAQTIGHLGV